MVKYTKTKIKRLIAITNNYIKGHLNTRKKLHLKKGSFLYRIDEKNVKSLKKELKKYKQQLKRKSKK